jgi:catechol 2,3-dioxygenase-like lactoylglutathione lyase family enzyme
MSDTKPVFRGGRNVAMKLPPHQYEATIKFYRDTLGLDVKQTSENSHAVDYGPIRLWLDRCEKTSHAELWLDIGTSDTKAAAQRLAAEGVVRCDAIEELPKGFDGYWIANPAGIVHIVSSYEDSGAASA